MKIFQGMEKEAFAGFFVLTAGAAATLGILATPRTPAQKERALAKIIVKEYGNGQPHCWLRSKDAPAGPLRDFRHQISTAAINHLDARFEEQSMSMHSRWKLNHADNPKRVTLRYCPPVQNPQAG